MIHELNDAKHLWTEVINIVCYINKIIYIRHILNKSPYEPCKGMRSNISYFCQFGCACYILKTKENFGKFDYDL